MNVEVAFGALDREAARSQRLEVSAPRDERDIGAGDGQAPAEIAADAAAADDRDPHPAADRNTAVGFESCRVWPQDADSGASPRRGIVSA